MTLPLLYSYRRCPYAMRARMALLQAQCNFDAHEIELRHKPAALLACSPKGTVPVLVLPDGRVLEESWHIMAWAWEHGSDPEGWAIAQTPENLALLHANDGAFKQHLDRYKYPERYADLGLHRDQHRHAAVDALLRPLEDRLQRHAHLGGDRPCATDLAVFPFVRQFAAVEPAWFQVQPWPALQAWLAHWTQSPLFLACMARLPANTPMRFPGLGSA